MPFDGTQVNEALAKMDQVIGMLATPERWCQGTEATGDGRRCIMGAFHAARAQGLLQPVVLTAITEVSGRRRGIVSFNDSPHTPHALVLEVLYKARGHIASGDFVMVPEDQEPMAPLDHICSWLFGFWGRGKSL